MAEHFSKIFNASAPSVVLQCVPVEYEQLDVTLDPPSREEIARAVNRLKYNKAPGFDDITGKMLKAGGGKLLDWLLRIRSAVWSSECKMLC